MTVPKKTFLEAQRHIGGIDKYLYDYMMESGAFSQVQADWNIEDNTKPSFIKNKPDFQKKLVDVGENRNIKKFKIGENLVSILASSDDDKDIEIEGGGSYNDLSDLPTANGVVIEGNLSSADLKLANAEHKHEAADITDINLNETINGLNHDISRINFAVEGLVSSKQDTLVDGVNIARLNINGVQYGLVENKEILIPTGGGEETNKIIINTTEPEASFVGQMWIKPIVDAAEDYENFDIHLCEEKNEAYSWVKLETAFNYTKIPNLDDDKQDTLISGLNIRQLKINGIIEDLLGNEEIIIDTDYQNLPNLPKLEGKIIVGDKTASDYNLISTSQIAKNLSSAEDTDILTFNLIKEYVNTAINDLDVENVGF